MTVINRYGFRCPKCKVLLTETAIVKDKKLVEKYPRLLKQFSCPKCNRTFYFQDLEQQTLKRFIRE